MHNLEEINPNQTDRRDWKALSIAVAITLLTLTATAILYTL